MIVVVLHTFKWAKLPMIVAAAVPASWRPAINKKLACKCYPVWLRLPEGDVDRWESLIIVAVSALTVLYNLVIGVGVGLFLAALGFSWQSSQVRVHGMLAGACTPCVCARVGGGSSSRRVLSLRARVARQEVDVRVLEATPGRKRYVLAQGKLFFGSAMRFHRHFDVDNDPADVTLELPTQPKEYSAADAIGRLSGLYAAAGKTLTIVILAEQKKGQSV